MSRPVCAVFAYGHFGCAGLDALARAGAYIPLVFSHHDNPHDNRWWPSVRDWCARAGVPVLLDAPLEATSAAASRLAALQPDFLFSFYFKHLLGAPLLALATRGAYNLHGSLLPLFRGRAPINWQLVRGARRSGVTMHEMVPRADAGGIVGQRAVRVASTQDAYGLTKQLLAASARLLDAVLPRLFTGTVRARTQDLGAGSVFGGRRPQDGHIDWHQDATTIHDLVRAVAPPWPGAFTFCGSERLMLNATTVATRHGTNAAPGTVLADGTIACGAGTLIPIDLYDRWARPQRLPAGTRLGPSSSAGVP